MGKLVRPDELGAKAITLWTPWGEQKASRPGERFAALRELVKRARSAKAAASRRHAAVRG